MDKISNPSEITCVSLDEVKTVTNVPRPQISDRDAEIMLRGDGEGAAVLGLRAKYCDESKIDE